MQKRYWRLYLSLLGIVTHVFIFDIVAGRWFAGSAVRRWIRLAQGFRQLAIDLGGVPIKLGQFLSVRVDVLPSAVTAALADLRDHVPPVPFAQIEPILTEAWQVPYGEQLQSLDTTPVAAASLGQVYKGVRQDGRVVAVKVLRPNINEIIETDLAAVQAIVRLIKDYPLIRRRADLQRLFDEFAEVLRQELDYRQEAQNNQRLSQVLRNDTRVKLPVIHPDLSTAQVLVMDWVYGISPDQRAALDAAGVDRSALAKALLEIFFVQCFESGTFHADPHPGNILIEPTGDGRWVIHLLDLGAVAYVPATLLTHLRTGVVALVGNDIPGIMTELDALDMILPDADRDEIQRVLRQVLAEVSNRSMSDMRNIDFVGLASDSRELLISLPFQIPQNVIYLGRALSLLSGVVAMIDPQINLVETARPLALRWTQQNQQSLFDEAVRIGRLLIGLPARLDRIISQFEQGSVGMHVPQLERQLRRLETAQQRRDWMLIGLLVALVISLWIG
ncbi:MAG: ABC1 kinase family protein [Roseiflexaceae bacterium]